MGYFRGFRVKAFAIFVLVGLAAMSARAEENLPVVSTESREFNQLLDEVLNGFESDLKAGRVAGLKDFSIRNIVVSKNIPHSFQSHLELLISERILKVTQARIVHCVPCRSKESPVDRQSPEVLQMAQLSNIENFMDISLVDQSDGMVLSLQISDVKSDHSLWERTYDSEGVRVKIEKQSTTPVKTRIGVLLAVLVSAIIAYVLWFKKMRF